MKTAIHQPRYKPPLAPIRIGAADAAIEESRYGTLLVWFMRALSVLWAVQGLAHWAAIFLADGTDTLESYSTVASAAVIFFCVIDLIAAVGLWLSSAWGGVVWLVAVASQWIATIILPGFFVYDTTTAVADLVLTAAYFFLTYKASVERQPYV